MRVPEEEYPCDVSEEELGFLIAFLLGQMPRSLVQAFAGKDGLKRDAAKNRMTQIMVERLARFQIRKGRPLAAHDGSATRT
ncbi:MULTISPECIES: hypothetical protein [unclassified Novosphingobium]|uniref:hypothetical protein n=1 Tax=unclassified Novosphingobium TaxID=2644732 RepID=UPI00135AB9E8|nr:MULTISPECIES: hypothetical protein [unclassified Novosphingobium]